MRLCPRYHIHQVSSELRYHLLSEISLCRFSASTQLIGCNIAGPLRTCFFDRCSPVARRCVCRSSSILIFRRRSSTARFFSTLAFLLSSLACLRTHSGSPSSELSKYKSWIVHSGSDNPGHLRRRDFHRGCREAMSRSYKGDLKIFPK